MKTQMITLATIEPTDKPIEVEAYVVGQLAIHSDEYDDLIITHVKTGCMLAEFSDFDDAREFCEKATELMDFDTYAQLIAFSGEKRAKLMFSDQLEKVKALRDSYASYVPDMMTREYAGQELIKARLQS